MKNQPLVRIEKLAAAKVSHAVLAGLDEVFFDASATRDFASAEARSAFRERWLGSYLTIDEDNAFIALAGVNEVAGYVVGALDDPAKDPRHAALGYFGTFAPWTALYPAHLHINVASQYRSQGLGARLIETFAAHVAARGSPGVHVVTGEGMRNVGFYLRNGFARVAAAPWNNRTVVMLGRALTPVAPAGHGLS